jgi:hypothetical protein
MKLNFRQGVVSCQQVGPQPDFLVLTGSFVELKVAPTPLLVTIAHGRSDYLLKFDTSVSSAWGPLADNVVNYLYVDVDPITGAVTRGITTREPIISAEAPPVVLDQHWFDLTTTTMKVGTQDVARWRKVIRLFVGRVIGTAQLVTNTIGTTVALNTPCDPGYLLFDVAGRPLRTSAGELLTSATPVRVHSTVGTSGVLTNSINNFIPVRASESIPAMSLVYFSDIDSVGLASSNPALNDQRNPIGIIELPLATNEIGVVTQSGEITHDGWDWSGDIGKPLYCGFHGELTTTRPVSIQAYRVGFVKNARTILFYVDAETIPQVVAQAGSLISGEPPIVAVTSTNSTGEIVTTVSLPAASAIRNGYLSSTLFTTLASLDPRITAAEGNITTLQSTKAAINHSHVIGDTGGLQLALDGRALLNHSHPEYAPIIHSHTEYALISHLHSTADVTGLIDALNGKAGVGHAHVFGDVAGLQAALDGKANTSHTHIIADVSGLQAVLDGKAPMSHSHVIGDVAGLQTALDGKAAVSHTQTASTITDFSEAVDDRVAALLVAGSNITLTYNDVANTLTVASTASGGAGGISTILANQTFDINLISHYETFTPTTLQMFGNSASGQPRIRVSDIGGGVAQIELVNTGTSVNGGYWYTGEVSSFVDAPSGAVSDTHVLLFDRQFTSAATTYVTSPLGGGLAAAVVHPQLLDIQQSWFLNGFEQFRTVNTFPRQITTAPNEPYTHNRLVFSKDFNVVKSGSLNEITTVNLVAAGSAVAVKDDNGTVAAAASAVTFSAGLSVSIVDGTTSEVVVTARCPSVSFTM